VASTVAGWYANPSTNYGLAIRYTNESLNDYNLVYSSEYSYTTYRPRLQVSYITDITPPSITAVEQASSTPGVAAVNVTATDTESGVNQTKYMFGAYDKSYVAANGTAFTGSFSAPKNGIYTIYAKDNVGNDAVIQFTVTTADSTPPSITAVEQESSTPGLAIVNVTATDTESGVNQTKYAFGTYDKSYVAANGVAFTGSFPAPKNGIYTIYAKDNAGNDTVIPFTVTKGDVNEPVNDTQTGAISIVYSSAPVTINGNTIYSNTDADYFKIDRTAGDGIMEIKITKPLKSGSIYKKYTVTLYNPEGTVVASYNSVYQNDYIRCRVDKTGTYYIKVSGDPNNYDIYNPYSLLINCIE
jgi:hypothetical protein